MFEQIKIDGVASYKSKKTLGPLKKWNFIFGLNGTGKSTISNFLFQLSGKQLSPQLNSLDFSGCSPEPNLTTNADIFVFNQSYIDNNFRLVEKQKGIYRLIVGTGNNQAQQRIDVINDIIDSYITNKNKSEEKAAELTDELVKERTELYDAVYEECRTAKNNEIRVCLNGIRYQNPFFDAVENARERESGEIDYTASIENLRLTLRRLGEAQTKNYRPLPTLTPIAFSSLEKCDLLKSPIVKSGDKYLDNVIASLSNEDWIRTGVNEFLDKTEDCPFCARTLDPELKARIRNAFDQNYLASINKLTSLLSEYVRAKDILFVEKTWQMGWVQNFDLIAKETIDILERQLNKNIELCCEKLKNPNSIIELIETSALIESLTEILTKEEESRKDFENSIANRNQTIEKARDDFLSIVKTKFSQKIATFRASKEAKEREIAKKRADAINYEKHIQTHSSEIVALKNSVENLDVAVKNINQRLIQSGFTGFSLKKFTEAELSVPSYVISRDGREGSEKIYDTLSEGEKTFIAFLYFVEDTLGRVAEIEVNQEKISSRNKKIIVIDDPISSLSINAMYETAWIIQDTFFKSSFECEQFFLFTHHLLFFEELVNKQIREHVNRKKIRDEMKREGEKKDAIEKEYALFRISKNEHGTDISVMNEDEVSTIVNHYWKTLRDMKKNAANSPITPSLMRGILEFTVSFMRTEHKMNDVFTKLKRDTAGDPSFPAFERFLNRGLHQEANHALDANDMQFEKWYNHFEKLFEYMNLSELYHNRMK